jgi:hypothetical protein
MVDRSHGADAMPDEKELGVPKQNAVLPTPRVARACQT